MKWLSKLLLPLCLVSSGYCLNLSDILTRARIFLRDTATDPTRQRFSDPQLTFFINDGQKETNLKVWAVVNSTLITLSAGTTEYSLPADHITILRATMNNAPIVERTFSFLDESNTNWIADTGTVTEYYLRMDSSVVAGVTRECIGVHPISTFTATMILQYLAQPADLSASVDVPFSGYNRLFPFHQALAYYAAYRGDMAIGSVDEAAMYRREYDSIVNFMDAALGTHFMFNPSFRLGGGGNLIPQAAKQ